MLYYTQIPYSQAVMDVIYFSSYVQNNGSATQSNIVLNTTVNDGANDVFNQNSSSMASLAPGVMDWLMIANPFTPAPMENSVAFARHPAIVAVVVEILTS